jgi:1,4-dihydroxy-2-naphthoate octaprenyltransferase
VLGAIIAWFITGVYDSMYLALSLAGVVCINAGTNLANDYFDYNSGCDTVDTGFNSPFSGGSGLLPRGILDPKKVHIVSIFFFALASLIGVFLALTVGSVIFAFGVIGIISGYFYTTQIATRGIGELIVGINCGPLAVLGSFYVQTQAISLEPLIASIPLGILIIEVLWINEIPDYFADSKAGKKTLVTRIGKKRAADVYAILAGLTYIVILAGVAMSLMPPLVLISLLTAPLALKAVTVARKNYDDPKSLISANATTALVHLFTGILLCLAYFLTGYFSF